VRAGAANATTTPTFAPNGLGPFTITKLGGAALGLGDIAGNLAEIILRYNVANTRFELLNPSNQSVVNATAQTGTVWHTLANSAPTGWLMFDDGTFGSASSGSSNSNSALNQALFNILFASPFTDATCPLLTSTGSATTRAAQGSAAAAWAANCRMTLPKTLGRALAVAGAGSGLTSRTMGVVAGAETVALSTSNLPAYTPSGTNAGISVTSTVTFQSNTVGDSHITPASGGASSVVVSNPQTVTSTGAAPAFTGSAQGGSATAFSVMQPSQFFNAIVKQ
jgi:hypothetical protein